MVTLFLLLIYIGIFFLIKSGYTGFAFSSFISFTIAMIIFGLTISFIARVFGGRTPFRYRTRRMNVDLGQGLERDFEDTHNTRDIREVPLDLREDQREGVQNEVADLLVRMFTSRVLQPKMSVEQILDKLHFVEPPQEGVCGVCYSTLDSDALLECPECHKSAHTDCLKSWFTAGETICIYCRCDFVKED